MLKFFRVAAAGLVLSVAPVASANAAVLGPDAAHCARGDRPAILVNVTGLVNRAGTVRARTFDGTNRASWFNKKATLKRTQVDIPTGGPVEICMPVPRAGAYVLDLRHDTNGNGDTDRADGAGVSGNPQVSLLDFFLGKKPPAQKVVVNVGQGVTRINVLVKYISGGSFKPAQVSAR
jgi:uncharacterized protein (DUF2141 family)